MNSLKDKSAIVTGSTRGIGLAIAEALLEEGVNVVVSSRNQRECEQVRQRLSERTSTTVLGKACDVADFEQVEELVEYCCRELGGLDILINNAGIGIFGEVEKLSPEEWRSTLATNLDGVFYACHCAIPQMKKRDNAFIINIGSLAGKNAFPGGAAYNASKFGLLGFTEALMQEVRHDDIRVACVMPGSVETSFSGRKPSSGETWKLTPSDVARVVIETLKRDPRCLTSRIEMRPSKPPKK